MYRSITLREWYRNVILGSWPMDYIILVRRDGIPLLNLYWGHVTTRLALVSRNNCIKKRLNLFSSPPPPHVLSIYFITELSAALSVLSLLLDQILYLPLYI